MDKEIERAEKSLKNVEDFIFNLRKFLYKNPELLKRYKDFINSKENLIY